MTKRVIAGVVAGLFGVVIFGTAANAAVTPKNVKTIVKQVSDRKIDVSTEKERALLEKERSIAERKI